MVFIAYMCDQKRKSMPIESRAVYSTGIGRIRYCRTCHQPEDTCRCHATSATARAGMPRDGIVRIALDRKGRAGKIGTLIVGLPDDDALLASICQTLKRLCGSGGTSKQGELFIQGDHRDVIEKKLIELGYRTKRVGG
jgi:translation initiation factor 1